MGLLDPFRRPKPDAKPSTKARASSGRGHTHGFIRPDEINPSLVGASGIEALDRMWRTDADSFKALQMVLNPIVGATWKVEPYGGDDASDEDVKAAEFVEWALFEHMSPKFTNHLAQFLPVAGRTGFCPGEQVWETTDWDGRQVLTLKSIGLRIPRTILEWHQDGDELIGLRQYPDVGPVVDLPRQDLVYYRFGAEGDNWEGRSLLRSAYKHWQMKEKLELVDAIAHERFRVGVPIAYGAEALNPDQLAALEDMLAGWRANEQGYMVIPAKKQMTGGQEGESVLIEILQPGTGGSGSQSGSDLMASLKHHTDGIHAAVLAEFMRLGQETVGARATAETQEGPFDTYARMLSQVVVEDEWNEQVIARLHELNFGNDRVPRLVAAQLDETALGELADYCQKLVGAGALTPDPELEVFLRQRAKLPPPDPEAQKAREELDQAKREAEIAGAKATADDPQGLKQAEAQAKLAAKHGGPLPKGGGLPGKAKPPAKAKQLAAEPGKPAAGKSKPNPNRSKRLDSGSWMCACPDPDCTNQNCTGPEDCTYENGRQLARQTRDLRGYEQHVQLDRIEHLIDGARDRFQAAGRAEAHALARHLAERYANKRKTNPKVPDAPDALINDLAGTLSELYESGRETVVDELRSQQESDPMSTRLALGGDNMPDGLFARAQYAAQAIALAIWQAIGGRAIDTTDLGVLQATGEAAADTALRAQGQVHAAPALNQGRSDQADDMADLIAGTYYTSILDGNRCDTCRGADDDVLRPMSDPVRLARKPPNPLCHGGGRCRCLEAFVLKSEAAPSA